MKLNMQLKKLLFSYLVLTEIFSLVTLFCLVYELQEYISIF